VAGKQVGQGPPYELGDARSTVTRVETCRRISKADDGTFRCTRAALL